jgi:hypothetical protein
VRFRAERWLASLGAKVWDHLAVRGVRHLRTGRTKTYGPLDARGDVLLRTSLPLEVESAMESAAVNFMHCSGVLQCQWCGKIIRKNRIKI